MRIRLTASKSSGISKQKRAKSEQPLLPSEALYLRNLTESRQLKGKNVLNRQEKLENLGPVAMEYGPVGRDLLKAMDYVQSIMWTDIPEKGLGKDLLAETFNHRRVIPPLITLTHLQAIFPNDSTYVDREIVKRCQQKKIRKLIVNLVKGGELLIKSEDYDKALNEAMEKSVNPENKAVFCQFRDLLESKSEAVTLDIVDLNAKPLLAERRDLLLTSGFLTFQPGRNDAFNISIPNLGLYLKLVAGTRNWVIKCLEKMKWKELLESQLIEKFEASPKAQWRDFKGCTMDWILLDCYGGGYCEPFSTPVGRGWKYVGKGK